MYMGTFKQNTYVLDGQYNALLQMEAFTFKYTVLLKTKFCKWGT